MTASSVQARVVVDEWVRGGVREVVACPGSRNAPLLLALHAADATGALRLHVRVDERSAGFLAVGLGAVTGRPVPVVVTSGTAVANLHPAVLEASHAGVPLLVVSADRPLELQGTGANQTVDQVGLFGSATRASVVLPLAETRPGAADGWRAAVCRALVAAAGTTTADPGPVQLDVPLREPLVPGDPDSPDEALPDWAAGRPDGGPWTRLTRAAGPALAALADLDLSAAVPTVVVAGHGASAPLGLPAGVPVVAEPTSALWGRGLATGPRLLDGALAGAAPDLLPTRVVVVGRPTLHRSVSRLLADPRVEVVVVPSTGIGGALRPGWTDVASRARAVGVLPPPGAWGFDDDHAARMHAADARVAAALATGDPDDDLADAPADPAPTDTVPAPPIAGDADLARPSGPALAAAVVAALPAGALLVIGSSNPIRDVALAAPPRDDISVLAARGVSGIDGAVSFATGAALGRAAAPESRPDSSEGSPRSTGPSMGAPDQNAAALAPTYALLGDLTFLHDAGGLAAGPQEPRAELVIVVANDDGGGVFATLEQGAPAHAAAFERMFATPHGTDLADLCRGHGVPHRTAGLADVPAALAPTGELGVRVVEVGIDRTDRRALTDRLRDRVRAVLGRRS